MNVTNLLFWTCHSTSIKKSPLSRYHLSGELFSTQQWRCRGNSIDGASRPSHTATLSNKVLNSVFLKWPLSADALETTHTHMDFTSKDSRKHNSDVFIFWGKQSASSRRSAVNIKTRGVDLHSPSISIRSLYHKSAALNIVQGVRGMSRDTECSSLVCAVTDSQQLFLPYSEAHYVAWGHKFSVCGRWVFPCRCRSHN